jgi:hypothetical protein
MAPSAGAYSAIPPRPKNFVVESGLEFLCERERMTKSDRAILDLARSFHQGGGFGPFPLRD